jgi:hypothetical protein
VRRILKHPLAECEGEAVLGTVRLVLIRIIIKLHAKVYVNYIEKTSVSR